MKIGGVYLDLVGDAEDRAFVSTVVVRDGVVAAFAVTKDDPVRLV